MEVSGVGLLSVLVSQERGSPSARIVALRRFDFDDGGAEVSQYLSNPRARKNPRQFDDYQVFVGRFTQWQGFGG